MPTKSKISEHIVNFKHRLHNAWRPNRVNYDTPVRPWSAKAAARRQSQHGHGHNVSHGRLMEARANLFRAEKHRRNEERKRRLAL